MKDRYYTVKFEDDEEGLKIELKAQKGKILEFSEGTDGELIIRKVPIAKTIPKDNCPEISTVLDEEHEEVSSTNTDIAVGVKNSEILEVSKETNGKGSIYINNISKNIYSELPEVSAGEYAKAVSVYTDKDGNKAVIPQGWTVSGVPSENVIWGKDMGMVIYYIPNLILSKIDWKDPNQVNILMGTYDQAVWLPVDMLSATSTIDGIHYHEKFGRKNYRNEEFSEKQYYEPIEGEMIPQRLSVYQYGGFYITRYRISKEKDTKILRSIGGAVPCTEDFSDAKYGASIMAKGESLMSHLTYGAEYDTRLKFAIETGTVTKKEIVKDSSRLGNYYNNNNDPNVIFKTGDDGCINNIYGFAGNMNEWTQERSGYTSFRVVRGSICDDFGGFSPVSSRSLQFPNRSYRETCFRATYYIKPR